MYMKPFDGGGWRGVSRINNREDLHQTYDESGEMLMHLQATVKYDKFARALSIGPETMVMASGRTSRCTTGTPSPTNVVRRYDPVKANLPPMTADEAVEYIAANKDARPWLAPAADCDPEVQRVYATLDTGLGHAHHRHDGMGDDELYERRVAYLEDPGPRPRLPPNPA